MGHSIFFALVTFIFVVSGLNERNFKTNAQKHAATILEIFTAVSSDDDSFNYTERELAKKAPVQLTRGSTDKRTGDIIVPLGIWQNLKVGDTIQVLAYPEHPKWVFWSPMIRYEHRDLILKINYAAAAFFFVLTLIFLSTMRK